MSVGVDIAMQQLARRLSEQMLVGTLTALNFDFVVSPTTGYCILCIVCYVLWNKLVTVFAPLVACLLDRLEYCTVT